MMWFVQQGSGAKSERPHKTAVTNFTVIEIVGNKINFATQNLRRIFSTGEACDYCKTLYSWKQICLIQFEGSLTEY